MFITKYYVAGAVLAFIVSYFSPSIYLTVILFWIGLSLAVVSAAYIFKAPRIFRKKENGAIPFYIRWVFVPFLLGVQLYNSWARKHDKVPPIQQIGKNLFIASRLFSSDVDELKRNGVNAILDVTAEFDGLDWTAQSEELAYLNIPVLDHQSPTEEDLLNAVNWMENQIRGGKGVVVHCAMGRGRSVLVMAAYLLSKQQDLTVRGALEKIQNIRPTAGLNKHQLKALNGIHEKGNLDLRDRAWIIANPVSGGGKWADHRDLLEQRLSAYFQLHIEETTVDISAKSLTQKAIKQGATTIIACGGDGTLTEVASQLVGTELNLGIIPFGTANALAHVLFGAKSKLIPVDVACDHIIEGNIRRIDTAQCNEHLMLLLVGVGFAQQMIENAGRDEKNDGGQFAYLKALWQAVSTNKSLNLKIKVDDQEEQTIDACSLVIANAAPFTTLLAQGGGEPNFEDGLLDVTWLPPREDASGHIFSMSELAISGLNGEYQSDNVEHLTAKKIKIMSSEKINYVIDGETYSDDTLLIESNPCSLNVIAMLPY